MRKGWYGLIVFVAVILLLYALRYPILRGFASFLIHTETLEKSEVIFVLSGSAYDRGMYAAKLYKKGLASRVVCSGGNFDPNMLALGREFYESQLTRAALITNGIDSNVVKILPIGTSTFEEGEAIKNYCLENNIHRCIIVTSLFHTKRVGGIIEKKLQEAGIETYVAGAPSRFYDKTTWWQSEYGLIDLNNEYIKLCYYFFKYSI